MTYLKYFKNRTLQTLVILVLFIVFANRIPLAILRGFYTVSVLIKDILVTILPVMVCFFIAASLAKFAKKAPLFIMVLLFFEASSNFISVWYGYLVGTQLTQIVAPLTQVTHELQGLQQYFSLALLHPSWWTVSRGMLVGLVAGVLAAQPKFAELRYGINLGKNILETLLTKVFARMIPLFVLGFVANMYAMDLLHKVFLDFLGIIIWIILAVTIYVFSLYLVAAKFKFSRAINNIYNVLPAGFVALTSGCSISTMPFTINGTKKNLQDPEFASMVIPATTNIQQIGDCIIQVLMCLVILKSFARDLPDLSTWLQFSCVFTLARFATAAVLGGAIFIILPLYVTYLGFSGEMVALILALNVILDPIVTSSNVMANAALCNILENIWNKLLDYCKNLLPITVPRS